MRLKATVVLHIPPEAEPSADEAVRIVAKLQEALAFAAWEGLDALDVAPLDRPQHVQDKFSVQVPSVTVLHNAGGESVLVPRLHNAGAEPVMVPRPTGGKDG
jgi:hypothetical protein